MSFRDALSNAERDEIITRNVAKLVQIPTPRYKVGKGLLIDDVKRILRRSSTTRLYALYVLAANSRACDARTLSASADRILISA